MNKDTAEGVWTETKGKIRSKWAKFTDNDLEEIKGNLEQIAGKLQKTYGLVKEKAEQEYAEFIASLSEAEKNKSEPTQKKP